jgi:hypothetical protein
MNSLESDEKPVATLLVQNLNRMAQALYRLGQIFMLGGKIGL